MDQEIHHLKGALNHASEPVLRWFSSYTEGAMTVTKEINRFAGERLQQNIDAWLAMTQTPNPAKVLEIQELWFWKAMRDYTDESQRLLSISGEVMHTISDQQPTTIVMQAQTK